MISERLKAHCISTLLSILATTLTVSSSAYATVYFDWVGTCSIRCEVVGLSAGDAVTATLGFNDAAIFPNAVLTVSDIAFFNFDFGSVQRNDPAQLVPNAFPIYLRVGPTGSFLVAQLDNRNFTQPPLGVGSDPFYYWMNSLILGTGLSDENVSSRAATAINSSGFEIRETPLPAALPLFTSGLCAMGLAAWRRKRKTTQGRHSF